MKTKQILHSLIIASGIFLATNVYAADCNDLIGVWRGHLGELTVELDLHPGNSTIQYSAPWGSPSGGLVGGAGFLCNNEETPSLWIWHQVGGNGGGAWYIRAIVDGRLNSPNEMAVKTFRFEHWSGSTHSGSGTLYKYTS